MYKVSVFGDGTLLKLIYYMMPLLLAIIHTWFLIFSRCSLCEMVLDTVPTLHPQRWLWNLWFVLASLLSARRWWWLWALIPQLRVSCMRFPQVSALGPLLHIFYMALDVLEIQFLLQWTCHPSDPFMSDNRAIVTKIPAGCHQLCVAKTQRLLLGSILARFKIDEKAFVSIYPE